MKGSIFYSVLSVIYSNVSVHTVSEEHLMIIEG